MAAKKIWFRLFASCIIVKGAGCSIISDIERGEIYDLPNDFLHVFELCKEHDLDTVRILLGEEGDVLDAFTNQFVEEELGFFTSSPENYPDLNLHWDFPAKITNAIVELDASSNYNLDDLISQLSELGCTAMQVRLLHEVDYDKLETLALRFDNSRISHLEILFPYTSSCEDIDYTKLVDMQPRIFKMLAYGAPEDSILPMENEMNAGKVLFLVKDLRSDVREVIKKERFANNIQLFTEAHHHNTGLNRKVCIDASGNIKNYSDHHQQYGQIGERKLKDVVADKSFTRKWDIHNDKIDICKDCQYRYSCVSNSDVEEREAKYYKVNMCSFNPYTNEWTAVGEKANGSIPSQ